MNEPHETVARIIDPEAWQAIEDGRDAHPDSLWGIRRALALTKADQVLAALSTWQPAGSLPTREQIGTVWRDLDRNVFATARVGSSDPTLYILDLPRLEVAAS